MIGRLLCRFGWHRWEFFDLAQRGTTDTLLLVVRTYCSCQRCLDYGIQVVNVELCEEDQPIRARSESAKWPNVATRAATSR
jgi:hypothetical protein